MAAPHIGHIERLKMEYYFVRILAGFLFMGSFGFGFLVVAEYGKWFGWAVFIICALVGIILHNIAENFETNGGESVADPVV